eukprot:CAMPEP_0170497548 /NCGR_PEP_ID=MMETSP0208-20121228/25018_1 /TAXON_ID=197538 /ORGANISM="Strombidium inclinatum, Strain S3" /LENGTH=51 /DNA_ID=CAMNT_0010774399 /DNA_START=1210 /DNA_END=1365 /DNA_ORIENTATION=+
MGFSNKHQQAPSLNYKEILYRIEKVEESKMKELYVKMISDTGQPPDFKNQL